MNTGLKSVFMLGDSYVADLSPMADDVFEVPSYEYFRFLHKAMQHHPKHPKRRPGLSTVALRGLSQPGVAALSSSTAEQGHRPGQTPRRAPPPGSPSRGGCGLRAEGVQPGNRGPSRRFSSRRPGGEPGAPRRLRRPARWRASGGGGDPPPGRGCPGAVASPAHPSAGPQRAGGGGETKADKGGKRRVPLPGSAATPRSSVTGVGGEERRMRAAERAALPRGGQAVRGAPAGGC
ncbi:translation initiation factor IF-2-like [Onychostruthus taczanowskii]|uniref:translation initiation factor IF-2-like n=1 Tax=Onychostruthus taczanowskii TaxID=356909 RepID=UPI001B801359|nr:translation initiation factor IF-2-like [Onychostruthus taczanowskii]